MIAAAESEIIRRHPFAGPSALMWSSHHLHGVLDMTPLPGFFGIAYALAGQRILSRLGDGLRAMLLEHLARDRVNLHFGYHFALLMFCHSEPQRSMTSLRCGFLQTANPVVSFQPATQHNPGRRSRARRGLPRPKNGSSLCCGQTRQASSSGLRTRRSCPGVFDQGQ
jgi:hypothetical protein